jgi:hypothetical protein
VCETHELGTVRAVGDERTFRRGKWTKEEEDFTLKVVESFKAGVLPLAEGTTLRNLLSVQLHCAPMRITKKFSKDESIGKVRLFARCVHLLL